VRGVLDLAALITFFHRGSTPPTAHLAEFIENRRFHCALAALFRGDPLNMSCMFENARLLEQDCLAVCGKPDHLHWRGERSSALLNDMNSWRSCKPAPIPRPFE